MSIRGEYWWIRLHAGGVDWAHRFSGESVPRQQGSCDEINTVPAPAGARLVLCVPGERARTHRVSLPTANRKRVLAMLPYALEDQLLHDIDAYHLVPLQAGDGSRDIPVVVVEKAWLSALLEQCLGAGWQPAVLLPDYLFMPAPEDGCWLVDAGESSLLLRRPGREGAVLAGGTDSRIPGALLLALEQADRAPHGLRVRVTGHPQYKAVTAWSTALSERNIELDVYMDESSRSTWLAHQPLPDSRLSLLTGQYAVKRTQGGGFNKLKRVGLLAAVLVLVIAAEWILQGVHMQSEHDQLQQAMETTYRRAFPDTKNLVDPRFQMEQQLAGLRSGMNANGEHDFLGQLDRLASMLAVQPDCRLQLISFDGNSITVELSVADYESFERLQQQLAQSVKVNVENAELRDGRVHGRIRVGGQA